MNLGTPIRLLKALPSSDGRFRYRIALRSRLWNIKTRIHGDRGIHSTLLGKIPIVLNPHDNFISRCIFENGTFESAELSFISDHLKPGMIAADVGANIGVHTLVMASSVGIAGSVHSFEPSAAFSWLSQSIRLSRLEQVITANNLAVGSREGTLKLNKCSKGNETYTSASEPLIGGSNETFEIPVTTLDRYAQLNNIEKFDLVKIDVEGHELHVFKGCESLLTRGAIRAIIFEVNNTCLKRAGTTSGELTGFLRKHGYELSVLDETRRLTPCPAEPGGDWTTVVGRLADWI